MDDKRIREICEERLGKWTEVLVEEHCTPAILIGVGHDQVSGAIHMIIPEDWSEEQAIAILTGTLAKLTEKQDQMHHKRN